MGRLREVDIGYHTFLAMKWLWPRNFALLGFPFLISAAIAKRTQRQPAWEKTTKKDHGPLSEIEPFLSVAPMYVGMDDLSMSLWEKGDLYQKANKKYQKRQVTPWYEGYWLDKHYLHMADMRVDPCNPFYPGQIPGQNPHPYPQPYPPMGKAGTMFQGRKKRSITKPKINRGLNINRARNRSPYSQRIPVQRPRGYPNPQNLLCQPTFRPQTPGGRQPPGRPQPPSGPQLPGRPQTPGGSQHPGVDPRAQHNPQQPYPQVNPMFQPHPKMNPWF